MGNQDSTTKVPIMGRKQATVLTKESPNLILYFSRQMIQINGCYRILHWWGD